MEKIKIWKEGFEGILMPSSGRKDKVVILMSGSNGGMSLTEKESEFYAENGIPVLALALFATKHTPKYLDRIPVECVENAIKWLKSKGYEKIGIDGMSKGSEIALFAASMFPEINCVIARVPSHFISEGLIVNSKGKVPSGTSCWSYKGKEILFASYKVRSFDILKMLKQEKELHIITFNKDKDVAEENLIPVEKIKAPVLLLSSKNDSVWPSYESSLYIENKLQQSDFPYKVKHVAFDAMSHSVTTSLPFSYKIAFKAERKNPKECKKEREILKAELLNWVEKVWN